MNDKVCLALQTQIYEFANSQFKINEISPIMAKLIIDGVCNRFQVDTITALIKEQIVEPNSTDLETLSNNSEV